MKIKKKSKLQKKIDDENSKLWKNKCDKLWRQLVSEQWNKSCAICGSKDFVQAHHLIPREMHSHRHLLKNAIFICASHHKYSFELSPHKAPVEFFRWLIKHHPDIWAWLMEQIPSRKNIISFKETAQKLLEQINAKNNVTEQGAENGLLRIETKPN